MYRPYRYKHSSKATHIAMKLKMHEIKNILISNIRRNDIIYDMI